jgi:hypothetical protein
MIALARPSSPLLAGFHVIAQACLIRKYTKRKMDKDSDPKGLVTS